MTFNRLITVACLSLMLVWVFAAGLTGSFTLQSEVYAQTNGDVPGKVLGNKSDADIWRQIRRGQTFNLSGTETGTGVLVQSPGEDWRSLRNGPLSYWGGLLMLVSLGFVTVFFLVRGPIKISSGRSGNLVSRFSRAERWAHWGAAIPFVLLGFTGVFVMFGRYIIAPIIGKNAWSVIAAASLEIHNIAGPVFAVALVFMLILYLKDNVWQKGDFTWVLEGGFFSKGHPPSWKYNFGEKSWYWLLFFAGLAISGSGLLLDFPWIAENVQQLQLAHLIHAGLAVILIAGSLGHIYLGTIGVEGAYEGMYTGEVDKNWAEEHHGWWAEDVINNAGDASQGAAQDEVPAE